MRVNERASAQLKLLAKNGRCCDSTKAITVASRIYAAHVYPGLDSLDSATADRVNIVLSDDEALNLARHLVQAARETTELTIMVKRKPSVKKGDHPVTVTYQPRKKK